ncbi:MAG TPA: hypothetical protein VMF14_13105 [Solirubrobacteraceae bacterium]|nr:hypothetical protein [Solirubrobacteraceae bacterium]
MRGSQSQQPGQRGHDRLRGSLDGPSKTITVEPIQLPAPSPPQRIDSPDPPRRPERPREPAAPREPAR